jgi:hypothetical protein
MCLYMLLINFLSNIDLNNILNSVKDIINKNYLNGLEAIYIGDFKDFEQKRYSIHVKRWSYLDLI